MADIVPFGGVTRLNLDPDKVLQSAIGEMTEVVICGLDKDGNRYFASTQADGGEVLWHLERARWALMQMSDDLENRGMSDAYLRSNYRFNDETEAYLMQRLML